jgi:uncharacterized cupredoxin-like copper-binding protein
MVRRVVLVAGVSLASLLLGLTGTTTRAQQDQDVQLRDFTIEPTTLTVNAGDTIRFNVANQGAREHNLELELESAGIEQTLFPANLKPGESGTVEFTFTEPGTWEFYCPVGQHRDRGMVASIQDQAAVDAPASQPDTSASQPADQAPEPTATLMPTPVPVPPTATPVPPKPAPAPAPRRGY